MICGVDEAGRGPLAGDVFAAAVILSPGIDIAQLADSKKLSPNKRQSVACIIRQVAISYAIARATVEEIDRYNILQATLLAMKRAVEALHITPTLVIIDGNHAPQLDIPTKTQVDGDSLIAEISAASILAKTARDEYCMSELDVMYPQYQFAKHKGYPTALHRQLLERYGPTKAHRRSFSPVQKALERLTSSS